MIVLNWAQSQTVSDLNQLVFFLVAYYDSAENKTHVVLYEINDFLLKTSSFRGSIIS
jgi:hypothetical protein